MSGADTVVMTEEQKKRQRRRSIAIALTIIAVAVLFYFVTIYRLGQNVLKGRGFQNIPPIEQVIPKDDKQ